jgi:hypothetical protein
LLVDMYWNATSLHATPRHATPRKVGDDIIFWGGRGGLLQSGHGHPNKRVVHRVPMPAVRSCTRAARRKAN